MRKYEKKHVFGLEIWLRIEIKTLYELDGQLEQGIGVEHPD